MKLANLEIVELDEYAREKWRRGETKETFVFSSFDPAEDSMWHLTHCHSMAAALEEWEQRIRWGHQVTKIRKLVEVPL